MRLVAVIEDPEVARKIPECLDLSARASPPETAPGESVGYDGVLRSVLGYTNETGRGLAETARPALAHSQRTVCELT